MAAARGVVRGHPAGGLGRAFALFALDWFLSGDVGRGALYSGVALLQVASAAFVLRHQRVRVGPDGLDVPVRWRLVILSWSEIVDVRGEGGAGSEYVVVERREGPPVRLPRGLRQRTVTRWRERYSARAAQPGSDAGDG